MSTTKKYELDQDVIKELFTAIEKSGVSIQEFNCLDLCDRKAFIFGDPATSKRRAVQYYFAEAKRKTTPLKYKKYITKFGVKPGPCLQKVLDGVKDDDDDDDKKEEKVEEDEDEDEGTHLSVEEDSEFELDLDSGSDDEESSTSCSSDDGTIKDSSTIKGSTRSASTKRKAASTPQKKASRPKDIQFQAKVKKVSPAKAKTTPSKLKSPAKKTSRIQKRMQSDTEPEVSSYTTDESYSSRSSGYSSYVESLVERLERPENIMDGTLEHPCIILADPNKPEKGNGIEVAVVPNVKVGNQNCTVVHIRRVTTQGMEDEWSAVIPIKEFPCLADRAILIRGPSQEVWFRRTDIHHEESFCSETAKVHEVQQSAINSSRDKVRMHSYHLVVLKKGFKLENYIISHDPIHVKMGTQEMAMSFETEDDDGKTELETLYGMAVHWRVALKGANNVADPGSATKKKRKKKSAAKKM